MRTCPRCTTKDLSPHTLEQLAISGLEGIRSVVQGLVVDLCKRCSGLFFDSHGVEVLAGDAGRLLVQGAKCSGASCPSCSNVSNPGEKDCSSCGTRLGLVCPGCQHSMLLAKVLNVELDICQGCDAVWFDDGELSKVVRRYQRRQRRKGRSSISGSESTSQKTRAEDSVSQTEAEVAERPTRMCLECKKADLRPRDVYKTPDGFVCRECMPTSSSKDGNVLSAGMMNDGTLASNVVDAMVTLTVVDAILDLFSSNG